VILDPALPGNTSGLELLWTCNRMSTTRDVPVIVVSAYAELLPQDASACAAGVLQKPGDLDELVTALKQLLVNSSDARVFESPADATPPPPRLGGCGSLAHERAHASWSFMAPTRHQVNRVSEFHADTSPVGTPIVAPADHRYTPLSISRRPGCPWLPCHRRRVRARSRRVVTGRARMRGCNNPDGGAPATCHRQALARREIRLPPRPSWGSRMYDFLYGLDRELPRERPAGRVICS
jgi:hypothetical protein